MDRLIHILLRGSRNNKSEWTYMIISWFEPPPSLEGRVGCARTCQLATTIINVSCADWLPCFKYAIFLRWDQKTATLEDCWQVFDGIWDFQGVIKNFRPKQLSSGCKINQPGSCVSRRLPVEFYLSTVPAFPRKLAVSFKSKGLHFLKTNVVT